MRKIRITEEQLQAILESELGYPLDTKADDGKPENASGYEVGTNNLNPDAPKHVPTADGITKKRSKQGWFAIFGYKSPLFYRMVESENLDNRETSGYGKKSDAFIHATAENNGGKMVANISAEIDSNTRGTKNNTNQKRIERMEDDKINNPENFQKNGGDETLNILKRETKKISNTFGKTNKKTSIEQPKAYSPNDNKQKIYYF